MQKAPLTFRLYQSVRFNRPIDKEKDFISPGGYGISVKDEAGNERYVEFDFEDYEGNIDRKDSTIVHCMQKNPDYDSFDDLDILNEHMLKNITTVDEWFIFTGEPGDTKNGEVPLMPVEILNPEFEIIIGDKIIRVPVTAAISPSCNFS